MAASKGSALLSSVEALFENTESIVIAAFQAQKISQNADSTGTQLLKALGAKVLSRDVLRPAVIVFTVKRSLTDRGFLPSIHFARPLTLVQGNSDGGIGRLELRKSFPLKSLHDVRISPFARSAAAAAAASAGRSNSPAASGPGSKLSSVQQQQQQQQQGLSASEIAAQQIVEVRCASHHNMPEHRGQYVLPDSNAACFMVSLALQLLRQQDAVLPSVGGVAVEKLDGWWSAHRDEVTHHLSSFALEVVTPGTVTVGRSGDESCAVLVSHKEAAELEELLSLFKLGLGETEQFAAALQEEAAALEAANVYAMLQSTPMVDAVIGDLRRTQSILDDLDESLKVFDLKLRHMRDDIAAIEASNNSLECQARQNNALLVLLERLLNSLELDQHLVALLERPAFDPYKLHSVVSAAWQLHARRLKLTAESADALSPLLTQMRVVKEAQAHLDDLTARFVSKVLSFLSGLVGQLVGEALADAGGGGHTAGGGRYDRSVKVLPPTHHQLHVSLRRYSPLIQVMGALQPQALHMLQQQVCEELNGVFRRECRLAAGELRRGATADLAASGSAGEGDYNMTRDRSSAAAPTGKRPGRSSLGSGGAGSAGGSDSLDSYGMDPAEFAGAAAQGASAAKRTAFLEGVSPGIPLHEAWSLLLDGFMPLMAHKAGVMADMLLMYSRDEELLRQGPPPLTPSGNTSPSLRSSHYEQQQQQQQWSSSSPRTSTDAASALLIPLPRGPEVGLTYGGCRAMELLLSGLEGDFTALSDLTTRSHQVLMLPMLAIARGWHATLSSQPPAQPLVALLQLLIEHLQQHWTAFSQHQLAAVEQYDGRSKMGLQQGIKHLHVFPFVSQFCLMVHDMEVGLAEGLAAVAAAVNKQQQQQHVIDDQLQQQQQDSEEQPAALAAAATVRQDADMLYHTLLPAVLSRIERLASSDPKYTDRCRLENYCFMGEALKSLAGRLPALQEHWQVAESRRDAALSAYVQDQLSYSKLWRLLEFGDKVDALLKVVSPPEVSFQKDCSPAEVRSLMRSTMDGVDKKLEAMAGRVRKHLGHGPLFNMVWGTLKAQLLARYEHLEWLLEQCYPTTPLRPSPEELRELFRATSAG